MGTRSSRKIYSYDRRLSYRNGKKSCDACGRSLDVYHDDEACAEEWLKRCDKEAAKAKQGGDTV